MSEPDRDASPWIPREPVTVASERDRQAASASPWVPQEPVTIASEPASEPFVGISEPLTWTPAGATAVSAEPAGGDRWLPASLASAAAPADPAVSPASTRSWEVPASTAHATAPAQVNRPLTNRTGRLPVAVAGAAAVAVGVALGFASAHNDSGTSSRPNPPAAQATSSFTTPSVASAVPSPAEQKASSARRRRAAAAARRREAAKHKRAGAKVKQPVTPVANAVSVPLTTPAPAPYVPPVRRTPTATPTTPVKPPVKATPKPTVTPTTAAPAPAGPKGAPPSGDPGRGGGR
ncbi:MAG: hypothetical protein JWO02_1843 [Solirubrobacterales bacterium]|nr:hypothetical protein [Solirubrobacterales bacterium]